MKLLFVVSIIKATDFYNICDLILDLETENVYSLKNNVNSYEKILPITFSKYRKKIYKEFLLESLLMIRSFFQNESIENIENFSINNNFIEKEVLCNEFDFIIEKCRKALKHHYSLKLESNICSKFKKIVYFANRSILDNFIYQIMVDEQLKDIFFDKNNVIYLQNGIYIHDFLTIKKINILAFSLDLSNIYNINRHSNNNFKCLMCRYIKIIKHIDVLQMVKIIITEPIKNNDFSLKYVNKSLLWIIKVLSHSDFTKEQNMRMEHLIRLSIKTEKSVILKFFPELMNIMHIFISKPIYSQNNINYKYLIWVTIVNLTKYAIEILDYKKDKNIYFRKEYYKYKNFVRQLICGIIKLGHYSEKNLNLYREVVLAEALLLEFSNQIESKNIFSFIKNVTEVMYELILVYDSKANRICTIPIIKGVLVFVYKCILYNNTVNANDFYCNLECEKLVFLYTYKKIIRNAELFVFISKLIKNFD